MTGKHTGRTDVPLTERGRDRALGLRRLLAKQVFQLVLTSPLARAYETCRLAGLGEHAQPERDLVEWDYGVFEGRTTTEIRAELPNWSIWQAEIPEGESLSDVSARTDRVIAKASAAAGHVALFAHGHVLRILAARWLRLSPNHGRLLALDTGGVSVLGHERETRVIRVWNRSAD